MKLVTRSDRLLDLIFGSLWMGRRTTLIASCHILSRSSGVLMCVGSTPLHLPPSTQLIADHCYSFSLGMPGLASKPPLLMFFQLQIAPLCQWHDHPHILNELHQACPPFLLHHPVLGEYMLDWLVALFPLLD